MGESSKPTREGTHALSMRAIHGVKAKNILIDSLKTAGLIRGGLFSQTDNDVFGLPCALDAGGLIRVQGRQHAGSSPVMT